MSIVSREFANNLVQLIASSRGPAFSAVTRSAVVACAGVQDFWPGVGEAWAIVADRRYAKTIHKAARRFLDEQMGRAYHRIQATVPADYAEGNRWLKHLGFGLEARLRAYSPDGQDFNLWALVCRGE